MTLSRRTLARAAATLTAAAALGTALPAAAHQHGHHKAAATTAPNIVQTAMSTGVHNTLVAAVKAAGLVDTDGVKPAGSSDFAHDHRAGERREYCWMGGRMGG